MATDERVLCGARTRNGGTCHKAPVLGRTRCRMHGGATPRGIASPHLVDGRRSKDLPTRLGERYHEALADEDLLILRDDVALIDARLGDVLSRVDSGESGRIWKALKKAAHTYNNPGSGEGAQAKRYDALMTILDLIEQGAAEHDAWQDVRSLVDQRARLIAAERQRLVQLQQTITVEQAMTMLAAVVNTIKAHVSDEHALAAISSDLSRLVNVNQRGVRSSTVASTSTRSLVPTARSST